MCYSGKCKLEDGNGECNVRGIGTYTKILEEYGIVACYIGEYQWLTDEEGPVPEARKTPEELEAIRKELKEKGWIF
jgi:hypothetical protein